MTHTPQVGLDAVIDCNGADMIKLLNVNISLLNNDDFVFA